MKHHVSLQYPPKPTSVQSRSSKAGCRHKRRFAEEIDAKMALAIIRARDSSKRSKIGMEKRPYLCEVCKGFHLTSWEKPPALLGKEKEVPKKTSSAPQIEDALVVMFNEMFANMGSTEEYNTKVAQRIQSEVNTASPLLERIIINEVTFHYLDAKAGKLIAEVVSGMLKK